MGGLQQLQGRLSMAMSALQTALTAVSVSLPTAFATSPFRYEPVAFELARSTLQKLLDMPHPEDSSLLLSLGELWRRGFQPTGPAATPATDAMTKLFPVRLHLHRGEFVEEEAQDTSDSDTDDNKHRDEAEIVVAARDDRLFLRFSSTDAECDEKYVAIELDETVRLRRLWSHELAAELAHKNGDEFIEVTGPNVLCYEICPSRVRMLTGTSVRPLVLVFQYGGQFSAEAFEVLVTLATHTCLSRDGTFTRRTVDSVCDPDNPAAVSAFIEVLQARVGPLQGAPRVEALAPRTERRPTLSSPMRGLSLDSPAPE